MPSIRPAIAVAYSQTMNCAAERAADEDLALVALAEVELVRLVDEADDLQVGGLAVELGRDRERGRRAGCRCPPCRSTRRRAARSSRRGPTMCVPSVTRPSLSRRGLAAGDRRGQDERGVVRRCRSRPRASDGSASSSSSAMSTPARPARHQAERGERRVAAADVRVGVEDAVAGVRAPRCRAANRGR